MQPKKLTVGFILILYLISLTSGAIQKSPDSERSSQGGVSQQEISFISSVFREMREIIREGQRIQERMREDDSLRKSSLAFPRSNLGGLLSLLGILLILPVGMVLKGKSSEEEGIPPEFWEDMKWGEKHMGKLQEKYIGKWVAVVDKKVVASAEDPGVARETAQKKTSRKFVPVIFVESGESLY